MLKLLFIGEACQHSGLARITHSLCNSLHKYCDLIVFGIGYKGDPHEYPYQIYPASLKTELGTDVLSMVINETRPDVVVINAHPSVIAEYMKSVDGLAGNTVALFEVDGDNLRADWAVGLAAAGLPLARTEFSRQVAAFSAAKVVQALAASEEQTYLSMPATFGDLKLPIEALVKLSKGEIPVLRPGVDTTVFHPLEKEPAKQARRNAGFDDDTLVVGCVGSNSESKRYDTLFNAISKMPAERKVGLIVHAPPYGAYDLFDLAEYYDISKQVRFTWNMDVPDETLCGIYSLFDVQVNVSSDFGFPLVSLEGLACGIPQVLADIGDNECCGWNGKLIGPSLVIHTSNPVNATRALLSPAYLAQILDKTDWSEEAPIVPPQSWQDAADVLLTCVLTAGRQ